MIGLWGVETRLQNQIRATDGSAPLPIFLHMDLETSSGALWALSECLITGDRGLVPEGSFTEIHSAADA